MIKRIFYIAMLFLLPFAGSARERKGYRQDSLYVPDSAGLFADRFNPDMKSPVGMPENGRLPLFIGAKFGMGQVMPTNDFVSGDNRIKSYWDVALKFGVASTGNRWQDIAYGMPYYGVAVYMADFDRKKDLGRPFAVYLLQGATIAQISKKVMLNYEWNLGASMGWKGYDAFDNPQNVAIGSETNVHVGYNLYFKWKAAKGLDLHIGADLSHNSNGAQKLPNSGINKYSLFVEAVYNFNEPAAKKEYDPNLIPPKYNKRTQSEILLTLSSRQREIDTVGTNMPSKYLDKKFSVYGFNYAFLIAPHYRYRYGGSIDLLYDESSGVTAKREQNPHNGKYYDRVYLGKPHERFSMGVSARGEIVLPGYSIFANLGFQAIHGNSQDSRLYQVIGVKIYLKENFFGTFGIKATKFSKASYLFWSMGYTIDHYRRNPKS